MYSFDAMIEKRLFADKSHCLAQQNQSEILLESSSGSALHPGNDDLITISNSHPLSHIDLREILLNSDPWRTLGFNEDRLSELEKTIPFFEILVALHQKKVVGFALIQPGFLLGKYLRILAVREDFRSSGIGSQLMEAFELKAFSEVSNVYLCVSSFNGNARRFYERRGYSVVGLLEGLILPQYDELLMRKTQKAKASTGALTMN